MFDENQLITIHWNNIYKKHYIDKGYIFTKQNDSFTVKAKDLTSGSAAKVKVICDYCGKEFETGYFQVIKGRQIIQKDCCSYCTGKKTSEISYERRKRENMSLVEDICRKNGYELLTSWDEYTDVKMTIKVKNSDGKIMSVLLDNFKRGHIPRQDSYTTERFASMRLDSSFVKKQIESINGNILLNPDEYIDSYTLNLKIQCSCGQIFKTSYTNYMRANVNRCPICVNAYSLGEKRIKDYLEKNSIDYISQKRFFDCRDKKPLPFDFYLPEYNLIIEFDGQGHYDSIFGEESYSSTKKHDKIKNKYCSKNNINLLRIPYWEGNKIEEIIQNKLEEIGKRNSLVS